MRYLFLCERRFYQYVILRIEGFLKNIVNGYRTSPILPSRLKHFLLRPDLIISAPERCFVAKSASIGTGVKFTAPDDLDKSDTARLDVDEGVFLGAGVELGLAACSHLSIGANTSMHEGTVILGNVRIGANCILSYNIFIASGNHVIAENPTWLIRDQDETFLSKQALEQVVIGDDVWMGWGVFVKSGVTIGRGAVVGANAVVTKDIEPYAICAGNPAQKISARLAFIPPAAIQALSDACIPYFYSGFLSDQASLKESRISNLVWMDRSASVLLQCKSPQALRIRAKKRDGHSEDVDIHISINGTFIGKMRVTPSTADCTFNLPETQSWMALKTKMFANYLEIGLQYSAAPRFSLGIEEISLQSN